jgi:hypothetical protein
LLHREGLFFKGGCNDPTDRQIGSTLDAPEIPHPGCPGGRRTLFQPVGGMDMIVEGFLRAVGHLITYDAPVTGVRVRDDGVTVWY